MNKCYITKSFKHLRNKKYSPMEIDLKYNNFMETFYNLSCNQRNIILTNKSSLAEYFNNEEKGFYLFTRLHPINGQGEQPDLMNYLNKYIGAE